MLTPQVVPVIWLLVMLLSFQRTDHIRTTNQKERGNWNKREYMGIALPAETGGFSISVKETDV